jgi:hypothetical protein
VHALLQQTPSTQNPLAQSVLSEHDLPFGLLHVPSDVGCVHE